jgi:hypothetical protein
MVRSGYDSPTLKGQKLVNLSAGYSSPLSVGRGETGHTHRSPLFRVEAGNVDSRLRGNDKKGNKKIKIFASLES